MALSNRWLSRFGFQVDHTPGISRAWQLEFPDGSIVLVTDISGFDLPDADGPYSTAWLSRSGEELEFCECLLSARHLYKWLQHIARLRAFQARQ